MSAPFHPAAASRVCPLCVTDTLAPLVLPVPRIPRSPITPRSPASSPSQACTPRPWRSPLNPHAAAPTTHPYLYSAAPNPSLPRPHSSTAKRPLRHRGHTAMPHRSLPRVAPQLRLMPRDLPEHSASIQTLACILNFPEILPQVSSAFTAISCCRWSSGLADLSPGFVARCLSSSWDPRARRRAPSAGPRTPPCAVGLPARSHCPIQALGKRHRDPRYLLR